MIKLLKDSMFSNNKYAFLFLINIVIVVSILIIHNFDNRFMTHNKYMSYGLLNAKYLATESHLWMEEYLSGDYDEYSKIDDNLNKSINGIEILLNGGVIKGFRYSPKYNDEILIGHIKKIKQQLIKIQTQKNVRIGKNIQKMDDEYDYQFYLLKDFFNDAEKYIDNKFNKMYSLYSTIKYVVYFSFILLLLTGLYLILKLNSEIKNKDLLSYIDTLTDIQNLKGYKENIKKLLSLYHKKKIPFTIMMFDIDDFKYINDTYGHKIGDIVLMDLTKLIKMNIRHDYDGLYRVGGEEFVVLCKNLTLNESVKVAEKIRKLVQISLNSIQDKTITISIGVTEVNLDDTEDSIYKRVDKYLYISKNNGKNKVTSDENMEV